VTRDSTTSDRGEIDNHAVQKLFWDTLARPVQERLKWLDEQDSDPIVAAEVRDLLAHHSTVDTGILATPPVSRPAFAGEDTQNEGEGKMPSHVGPFRIVRIIASGGMGTVYEAEQDRPRRTVALKVMSWGTASESTRRRFEFEAEALARLRHQGIAQLYAAVLPEDVGAEVPYIVMEYVPRARSITAYSRAEKLSRSDLLELFAAVCDAVHHGHQRGVIHRDLKPANILVNDDGNPKIIDFGVARLSDRDTSRVGPHTQAGQMVGTMSCMSPEQVLADPDDLDTRSDVYALGVVLYELLSLHPPYEVNGLSLREATEVITGQEPQPLGNIDRSLSGDLEIITSKALAKERDHRYTSASALAGDVRCFLEGLPIAARRPSMAYHIVRFSQRNRVLMSAAAIVVLALIAATMISVDYAISAHDSEMKALRAEQEAVTARDQARTDQRAALDAKAQAQLAEETALDALTVAEQARARSEQNVEQLRQISDFYLEKVLASADRSLSAGEELTIRKALDIASRQIDQVEDAEVRATLFAGFGDVYLSLSHTDDAAEMLEHAEELRRELHERPHQALTNTIYLLARAEQGRGHEELAMALYEEALQDTQALEGPTSDKAASILESMANLQHSLGDTLGGLARMEEARNIYARNRSADDPIVLRSQLSYFGLLRFVKTRIDVIGELQRMFAIEVKRDQLDEAFIAEITNMTGSFLLKRGDHAGAFEMLLETEKIRRRVLEPRHVLLASTLASKGICLLHLGRTDEAVDCFRESVGIYVERYGVGHPSELEASSSLGVAMIQAGRLDEAEAVLRGVWNGRVAVGDGDGLTALSVRANLGTTLTRLRRFEEAEQVLLRVCDVLENGQDFKHQRVSLEVPGRMVELYEAWGRPTDVELWAPKS